MERRDAGGSPGSPLRGLRRAVHELCGQKLCRLALADPSKATSEKERQLITEENKKVLELVDTAFERVELEDLSEDPRPNLPKPTSMPVSAVGATPATGLFLFGIVNQKIKETKTGVPNFSKEYSSFIHHTATKYTMLKMPSGDISKAKYFVPMFDGGFDGYYEITGISFGSRKQPLLDKDDNPVIDAKGEEIPIEMPCLNIKLGTYTSLGSHVKGIGKYRHWNGQVHSYEDVMELYKKIINND